MALPTDDDEIDTSQPTSNVNGSSTVLPGGVVAPAGTTDPNALLRQQIAEALKGIQTSNQPVQLPSLSRSPSDGTRPGWLGLLGEALSGGQSPLYRLSGQQEDLAGSRALMNFGINMMLASGPNRVKPSLFSAAASGLQGAQESMDRSQQLAYTQAGQQFEQQKSLADLQLQQQQNRIKTLQAMLPYLTLNQRLNMPSLYGPQTTGPGGGTGGGWQAQLTGDMAHDQPLIAKGESGGDPNALNYVALADPSAYARGATASGKYQIVNSTWQEGMKLAGLDPSQYATARDAPEAVQDKVFQAIYGKYGTAPWDPTKLKQNWVPTPTGQFILAGRATPAPQPGAQPTPTAAPGPQGPPGVQMGGLPPAPPGVTAGAATTPYTGGGIGAALVTNRDEALARAKATGQAVPIPGMQGQVMNPDGTMGAPPGGGMGKRAAADVIQGGMQTAAATPLVRGTGQEAGPSSAVATLRPAPTVGALAPGGGALPPSTIGKYDFGPAGATPTVTPPVVPTAQPGTQQPTPTPPPAVTTTAAPDYRSKNPDGSFVIPDEKVNVLQYAERNRHTPSPQELKQFGLVLPDNPQAAQDAFNGVQEAERDAAAARTAVDTIRQTGIGGTDVGGALRAVNAADANAQTARNKYTELIQQTGEKNAAALQNYYKEQNTTLASAHKDILDRQQQTALKTQEGQQAIALEQTKARLGPEQKEIEDLNQSYTAARGALDQLDLARSLSRTAGDPGFFQYLQQNHPETAKWLANMGFTSQDTVQKAGETNAMDAAFNRLITMAKFGTGFTRPTNLDVTILSSQAPGTTDPQAWREAKLAYMQSYMARQQDYVSKVRALQSQGVGLYDAEQQAEKNARPIVPQMDAATAADPVKRAAWATDLAPNTFFRDPAGRLHIWPPPPSEAPPQRTQAPPPGTFLVPTR